MADTELADPALIPCHGKTEKYYCSSETNKLHHICREKGTRLRKQVNMENKNITKMY